MFFVSTVNNTKEYDTSSGDDCHNMSKIDDATQVDASRVDKIDAMHVMLDVDQTNTARGTEASKHRQQE